MNRNSKNNIGIHNNRRMTAEELQHHREIFHDEDGSTTTINNNNLSPMSVTTGDDYSKTMVHGRVNNSHNRKAVVASFLTLIFLIIGYYLTVDDYRSSLAESTSTNIDNGNINNEDQQQHVYAANNPKSDPSTSIQHQNLCEKEYNTTYFNNLIQKVQEITEQSNLCRKYHQAHQCLCLNPFIPTPQTKYVGWDNVHTMNTNLIQSNYSIVQPDVVIYGDSITEHLLGRDFGKYTKRYQDTATEFDTLFAKRTGGRINGLPLGISHDRIAHLLYRLQNGEMPTTLQPKVWWILIGTNDLGMGCSIDMIVAGNIRIVQEIIQHQKDHNSKAGKHHGTFAPIVLNSLLPRRNEEIMYDPHSPWHMLQQINHQLYCYALNTPGIYFNNATDDFIKFDHIKGGYYINDELFLSDNMNPNANGSHVWMTNIIQKVLEFMT